MSVIPYLYKPTVALSLSLVLSVLGLLALLLFGLNGGILLMGVIVAVPTVIACFNSPVFTMYLGIFWATFIFLIQRLTHTEDLPWGIAIDVTFLIGAIGILIRKEVFKKDFFTHPMMIFFFLSLLYTLLQVANPSAHGPTGWLVIGLRSVIADLAVMLVFYKALITYKDLKAVVYTFVGIGFAAGLYGVYQELVSLPDFDYRWINLDEKQYRLAFIAGRLRKWSFLAHISTFGVVMAYLALVAIVLALGKRKTYIQIGYVIMALFMLAGMAYSGTRTAYVMVPIGFMFYALLTINRFSTIIASGFMAFGVIFILFGPIHGGTISRLRTAFNPSEDPSYQVREVKMQLVQPYIWSHPLGGGIGSTLQGHLYHPGHQLAGIPPDSGYLQTAMEEGWIGLIFSILAISSLMIYGTKAFYEIKNDHFKNMLAALLTGFFALSIGHFSQNAIGYLPTGYLNFAIYIAILKFKEFDLNYSPNEHSDE